MMLWLFKPPFLPWCVCQLELSLISWKSVAAPKFPWHVQFWHLVQKSVLALSPKQFQEISMIVLIFVDRTAEQSEWTHKQNAASFLQDQLLLCGLAVIHPELTGK